jgi:hypothetical protein
MLDARKLFTANGIPYITSGNSHCREGWLQVQCPFCGTDGKHGGWYLGWNLEQGFFHCWRCGSLRRWDVLKALLRRDPGPELGKFGNARPAPARMQKARMRACKAPPGFGPLGAAHRAYLTGRRFDPDALANVWDVGGVGRDGGDWAWRVVYPVHNAAGRVIAYQGRAVGKAEPRYRFTEDRLCVEDPKLVLYGFHMVPGNTVCIVEGVTGVWRIGPGAVATMGITWKREQLHQLRHVKNKFVMFDPEPAAQARALALARELAQFPGSTEVLTGFAVDSGAISPARAVALRKEIGL